MWKVHETLLYSNPIIMLHNDLHYSYCTNYFAECTLVYVGILSDFLMLP